MGPIETTLRAAHVLLEKGWTQGAYSSALRTAGGGQGSAITFVLAQSQRIVDSLVYWDWAPGRTKAEVLAENQRMYEKAAELGV